MFTAVRDNVFLFMPRLVLAKCVAGGTMGSDSPLPLKGKTEGKNHVVLGKYGRGSKIIRASAPDI